MQTRNAEHTFFTLKPEAHHTIHETSLSVMWFDDEGIFCSVTKAGQSPTVETLRMSFDYIRQQSQGKKVCWIGDVTGAGPTAQAARDFAAAETPQFVKALAIITNSSLSRLMAELFLLVKRPPYDTKLFANEQEAKDWIRQFLDPR